MWYNSELKPIAFSSRPAIANTLVVRCLGYAKDRQNMCQTKRESNKTGVQQNIKSSKRSLAKNEFSKQGFSKTWVQQNTSQQNTSPAKHKSSKHSLEKNEFSKIWV